MSKGLGVIPALPNAAPVCGVVVVVPPAFVVVPPAFLGLQAEAVASGAMTLVEFSDLRRCSVALIS